MNTPSDAPTDRRQLLALAATVVAGHATAADMPAAAPAPAAVTPPSRPPGRPGEFDFLSGHWSIRHRRRKAPNEWDEFTGEASCWSILGGVAHIEELRIPARNFSGMGLRLLDRKTLVWNDFWANAAFGVLGVPGLSGGFVDGVGIFEAEDDDTAATAVPGAERPRVRVRGVWDRITPTSCRWQQAASRDGGKTWDADWFMDWQRTG